MHHELTEKIWALDWKCDSRNEIDKIIRQWLTEKIQTALIPTDEIQEIRSHFGVTKKSCGCGACTWKHSLKAQKDRWFFKSPLMPHAECVADDWVMCPICGEKLGVV